VRFPRSFVAAAVAGACALGFGAASLAGGTHQGAAHRPGAAGRAGMALTAALRPATATPGDPIYLFISGIPGEVTAAGHQNWIEVDSYHTSFSATRLPAPRPGVRARMGSFVVTTPYSKAIPPLLAKLVSGKPLSTVKVQAVQPSTDIPTVYLSYTFNSVLVTGIQETSSGERPEETLVLQATKMSVSYLAPDGTTTAFCFNFASGKGC
jgi:type VI secretion system secreted protein Hcp